MRIDHIHTSFDIMEIKSIGILLKHQKFLLLMHMTKKEMVEVRRTVE